MKKGIGIILTLMFLVLITPLVTEASWEVDNYLQKGNQQKIIDQLAYTIYLDSEITSWAKPRLNSSELREGQSLLSSLENKYNRSAKENSRLGLLYLVLGDERKALTELTQAYQGANKDIVTLEPLLFLASKYSQQSLLLSLQKDWMEGGYPQRMLYYALGVGELKRGNTRAGEDYLEEASQQGYYGPAYLTMTVRYLEKNDLDRAGEFILTARERNREEILIHYFTALYHSINGEGPQAYSLFRSLPEVEALPDPYFLPYLENLNTYLPQKALSYWETMLKSNRRSLPREDILLNIVLTLVKDGNKALALDYLKEINSSNPIAEAIYYDIYKESDLREANNHLKSLERLVGTNPDYFMEAALIRERANQWTEATRFWKGIEKMYPHRPEPQLAFERIKKEKGGLWWTLTGFWLKADNLVESLGSLGHLALFKEKKYSKEKELSIEFPAANQSVWFSLDGLNWQWYSSPFGISKLFFPQSAASQKIHAYSIREGYGEYYQGIITVDFQGPQGSIALRDGKRYVNRYDLWLKLQAKDDISGVQAYRIREGYANWSDWLNYREEIPWQLEAGYDGERRLEVQYQDKAGNDSQVYSLVVILDRTAPELGDLKYIDLTAYGATIQIRADEEVAVEAYVASRFSFDDHKFSSNNYASRHDIQLYGLRSNTDYEVTLLLTDQAGNTRMIKGNSLRTRRDSTPPRGGISFAGGHVETNKIQVQLELWAQDDGGGTIYYSLSNDSYNWSSWMPLHHGLVSWNLKSGDGEKTVYVRYRDEGQNVSQTYSARIRLDSRQLTLRLEKADVGANEILISWSANKEMQSQINLKGSGINTTKKINTWSQEQSHTFKGLKEGTTYRITIDVTDRSGKKAKLGPFEIKTASPGENLAHRQRGTQATASSSQGSQTGTYQASNAIDGKMNTYWQAAEPPTKNKPQWLEISWKEAVECNSIKIYAPLTAPMAEFNITYQGADNKWYSLASFKDNTSKGQTIKVSKGESNLYQLSFPTITAKAISLTIYIGGDAKRLYLPQILEWEVYNY